MSSSGPTHPPRRRTRPALGGEMGVAMAVSMVTPLLLAVVIARSSSIGEVPRATLVLVPPAPSTTAPAAAPSVVLLRPAERAPPLPTGPGPPGVRHLEGTTVCHTFLFITLG